MLIIVQNLPVPLDRRVWQECRSLVRAGFAVSVICPKGPGDPAFAEVEGVRLHKYSPPPPSSGLLSYVWEFAYCWTRTAILACRVALRDGVDAVQACNPPDTYFALGMAFKAAGKPFVYDQHDLCPEVYAARFAAPNPGLMAALRGLERATYRTASHVISTNDSFRDVALERGGKSPVSVTVVGSGPDPDLLRPLPPAPELKHGRRYLCCYLGVMGRQDGVETVLRAAACLVHNQGRRDCHFALLGFGECYEELRRLARELGLEAYATFTGQAGIDVIRAYLSTADLGLSPDPKNAMNDVCTMNKVLEYMAFGVPLVAFDLLETRRAAGDAAMYVDDCGPGAFAGAVAALLDDPVRRGKMGRFGRQRFTTALSWRHQEPAYVGVYQRLLGDTRPGDMPAIDREIGLDLLQQTRAG